MKPEIDSANAVDPAVKQPLVSIITVVYNGAEVLERTLLSVNSQTYPHIEYIIVEGASKDGTLDLIQRYESLFDTLISEPDRGLYDAMNKGINAATGDFVWFLNAGDEIAGFDTLERMMNAAQKHPFKCDVIYGETLMVDENGQETGIRDYKTLPKHLNWYHFREGMVVCHQSLLVSTRIVEMYNLKYSISADIDWAIRCLQRTEPDTVLNVGFAISRYLRGGLSAQRRKIAWKDRFYISLRHFGYVQTVVFHVMIAIKYVWRRLKSRPE